MTMYCVIAELAENILTNKKKCENNFEIINPDV